MDGGIGLIFVVSFFTSCKEWWPMISFRSEKNLVEYMNGFWREDAKMLNTVIVKSTSSDAL